MAGIYIHIPFCKQACHYCDFHFSTSLKYKNELVDALINEIRLQKSYLNEPVDTIYFGGGTPSLLSANEINQIIGAVADVHSISADAEITLEANPDDLNKEKLQWLLTTPVNRLSVGVQSFFDEDLIWMNRAHRAIESETCIKRAQDNGFENLTIDLIYGFPMLTDQKWKYNLDKVFDLDVPHISSYGITVEPKTALASFIKTKKQPGMSDKQGAEQFVMLMDAMEHHGFEHYEISNFCKPGKYSRHNANYWKGIKYLGIGPSAHSYNGETRQWNVANNAKYLADLENNIIPAETEVLTEVNRLNEYIMTSLRTIWGLDLEKLNAIKAGASDEISNSTPEFFDKNWIFQKEGTIFLTQTGKLFADHIAAELFF